MWFLVSRRVPNTDGSLNFWTDRSLIVKWKWEDIWSPTAWSPLAFPVLLLFFFFNIYIFSFESKNYAAHAPCKRRTGILFYVLTLIKSSSSLFLTPTLHQTSLAGARDSHGPEWTCVRLLLQLSHTSITLTLVQHFLEFSHLFLSSVPFPIVGLFLWKTPNFDFIWIWLWTWGECIYSLLHLKAKVLNL